MEVGQVKSGLMIKLDITGSGFERKMLASIDIDTWKLTKWMRGVWLLFRI